jgi:hypothetical protein
MIRPFHPTGWKRRGGRAAEGAALEMLYGGNSIKGSNPFLSAYFVKTYVDFQFAPTFLFHVVAKQSVKRSFSAASIYASCSYGRSFHETLGHPLPRREGNGFASLLPSTRSLAWLHHTFFNLRRGFWEAKDMSEKGDRTCGFERSVVSQVGGADILVCCIYRADRNVCSTKLRHYPVVGRRLSDCQPSRGIDLAMISYSASTSGSVTART